MASAISVERVGDELLSCIICYEHFQSPKVLPCLHTFCQSCLERHFHIHRLRTEGRLSCPTCRELIPPPLGGVEGLKDDGVVAKIEELLCSLPGLEIPKEDEENDEEPLMACAAGIDPKLRASQKNTLQLHVTNMQTALAKLRNKILQLHSLENHVRFTIKAEVKAKVDKESDTGHPPSTDWVKATERRVQSAYSPTMAQLASEQDKLYQKIVAIKPVHDVTEEILCQATPIQIDTCYEPLMKHLQSLAMLVEQSVTEGDSPRKISDNVITKYRLPQALTKDESFMRSMSELNPPKRLKLTTNPPAENGVKVQLVKKMGSRGVEPGKFDYPTNASFLLNGDFVVTDKNNRRLQVYDNDGNVKRVLLEGLLKPRRAKVCPVDGYLYVSDELSTSVKVLSLEDGKEVRRIGESVFQCPGGIAFDSRGQLVATDPEKCSVLVFKRSGKLITKFYYRYFNDRNMPNPYFVTVNDDDQILVSDSCNGRIKVFSITGTRLFSIDNLDIPRGLCLDPYGNILVAESDKHRIAMYSPYGKFLQYLVNEGEHGLCYPMSLDMNDKGQLLVTQCGYYEDHQVLMFQCYST